MAERRLPDDYVARRPQKALIDGLPKREKSLQKIDKAMDLKKLLLTISVGWLKESSFAEDVIYEVRDNLHSILKESRNGDRIPEGVCVAQMSKIRLIQSLFSTLSLAT